MKYPNTGIKILFWQNSPAHPTTHTRFKHKYSGASYRILVRSRTAPSTVSCYYNSYSSRQVPKNRNAQKTVCGKKIRRYLSALCKFTNPLPLGTSCLKRVENFWEENKNKKCRDKQTTPGEPGSQHQPLITAESSLITNKIAHRPPQSVRIPGENPPPARPVIT